MAEEPVRSTNNLTGIDISDLSSTPADVNIYPDLNYLHLSSHVQIYRAVTSPDDINKDMSLKPRAFYPKPRDVDGLSVLRKRRIQIKHIKRKINVPPFGLAESRVEEVEKILSPIHHDKFLGVFCTRHENDSNDPHCVIWDIGTKMPGQQPSDLQKVAAKELAPLFKLVHLPEQEE
jgi:hypothetical protein